MLYTRSRSGLYRGSRLGRAAPLLDLPAAEYGAVRRGVGLCDLSQRGLVRWTGSERQRFLHAMVSNDTASLRPGEGRYATFLTHKGKPQADFVVYAEAEAYLLDMEPQAVRPFIDAIERFVISEDVTFHDESAAWGLLSQQGPQAAHLLTLALACSSQNWRHTLPRSIPWRGIASA